MRASPPHVPTYFAEKKLLETSKNQNLTFTVDIKISMEVQEIWTRNFDISDACVTVAQRHVHNLRL